MCPTLPREARRHRAAPAPDPVRHGQSAGQRAGRAGVPQGATGGCRIRRGAVGRRRGPAEPGRATARSERRADPVPARPRGHRPGRPRRLAGGPVVRRGPGGVRVGAGRGGHEEPGGGGDRGGGGAGARGMAARIGRAADRGHGRRGDRRRARRPVAVRRASRKVRADLVVNEGAGQRFEYAGDASYGSARARRACSASPCLRHRARRPRVAAAGSATTPSSKLAPVLGRPGRRAGGARTGAGGDRDPGRAGPGPVGHGGLAGADGGHRPAPGDPPGADDGGHDGAHDGRGVAEDQRAARARGDQGGLPCAARERPRPRAGPDRRRDRRRRLRGELSTRRWSATAHRRARR